VQRSRLPSPRQAGSRACPSARRKVPHQQHVGPGPRPPLRRRQEGRQGRGCGAAPRRRFPAGGPHRVLMSSRPRSPPGEPSAFPSPRRATTAAASWPAYPQLQVEGRGSRVRGSRPEGPAEPAGFRLPHSARPVGVGPAWSSIIGGTRLVKGWPDVVPRVNHRDDHRADQTATSPVGSGASARVTQGVTPGMVTV
jgi:hypothetical protein